MDAAGKKQYLADDPPTIVPLEIKTHFEALNDKEQKYAHYISKVNIMIFPCTLNPTCDALVTKQTSQLTSRIDTSNPNRGKADPLYISNSLLDITADCEPGMLRR